jgi:chromosome segregation ATPase
MNKNITAIGIMVVSCVVATGPTWAQMQPSGAQPQGKQSAADVQRTKITEQMQEVQKRASALQQRINTVAQKAQQQNPELQKLHAELMDIYKKKLAECGYPSDAEMQKLREMQERLQNPGASEMDEAERQQLTQQFNAEVAKMQEAQEKAQRDAAVLTAQQAFEEVRSKAMREIDPKVQKWESEFETVNSKLEELRMQLQQVMQAPQQ